MLSMAMLLHAGDNLLTTGNWISSDPSKLPRKMVFTGSPRRMTKPLYCSARL